MSGRKVNEIVFFILSLLGSLYLLAESFLLAKGSSVCLSEGCKLAARLTRFGDLYLVLTAFLALGILALISGLNVKRPSVFRDTLINLWIITALAGEGFFVGYQLFWLPEWCLFCLTVFGLVAVLSLIRFLGGWKEIAYGFAAFALVFILPALVLPPPGKTIPKNREMILFYSDDCKHCAAVEAEIAKRKLDIPLLSVRDYGWELKALGVDSVPTLWVNRPYAKLLLTGEDTIRRYLDQIHPVAPRPSEPAASSPTVKERQRERSSNQIQPPPLGPADLSPGSVFNPSQDNQACKQDKRCD